MFGFGKDKKEKEMKAIKDEINKPVDGPIMPENKPVLDRVSDINEKGEWDEGYKTPSSVPPAIMPENEPAPLPEIAPLPEQIEPIDDLSDEIEDEVEEMANKQIITGKDGETPLFIKVDKYSDLLAHVKEMKTFLKTFKQTLDVLREIENAKTDAVKILVASANRLERILETADQELLKPDLAEEVEASGQEEASHVEDTLESLKTEINSLKGELKRME
ncbi:hypothetical protein CL614_02310 [archaeon]|nr:hypothetical protein [archaeon]|tara:strand:- start:306 stop:962 length:657 start_codon:yes stop_codon:yes gene_type:complete